MVHPEFGKMTIRKQKTDDTAEIVTKSYVDNELDWDRLDREETLRLKDANDLLTPAVDLISLMKKGHTTEIIMTAKLSTNRNGEVGIVVKKTWLVSKEKM
jgi:hypothetical protein